MEATNYAFLRDNVASMIEADPTTVTFHGEAGSWQAIGRLAVAGSRTFGRTGQSTKLGGTELTGSQLHMIVLPYDTFQPEVADEVRTVRQGVQQRFTVVQCVPSPWKLDVIVDEVS